MDKFKNIIRALRLAFVSVSIFPFIFGSLLAVRNFKIGNFLFGLLCVAATHLMANLINDYADSKSGLDWQDRNFYKFFGGSKLIQERVFSEGFYLGVAVVCFLIGCSSALMLAMTLGSRLILILYFLIVLLAWAYSAGPLELSHRAWGEVIIFLLFGQVPVMGGYFIQAGTVDILKTILLSLPFSFLTVAILFANEVPDFPEDQKIGKITWAGLTGERNAFLLYGLLMSLAFSSIALDIAFGYLSPLAMVSFLFIPAALKATIILKNKSGDKIGLLRSSKLTIAIHSLVSIVLILGILV